MSMKGAGLATTSMTALFLLTGVERAQAASFDGAWSVLEVCETTSEGARGYTWRFDADVKNGHLVGQYRNKGQSPSMTLDGQIRPDGTATLHAQGISADAEHNVKFAQAQTPISFQVTAMFDGNKGNGSRVSGSSPFPNTSLGHRRRARTRWTRPNAACRFPNTSPMTSPPTPV